MADSFAREPTAATAAAAAAAAPGLRWRRPPHTSSQRDAGPGLAAGPLPAAHAATVQGAGHLVLFQILARGVTFTLNLALYRLADAATLGRVARLELLATTTLFLARENIRLALLRGPSSPGSGSSASASASTARRAKDERGRLQALANAGWIPMCVGVVLLLLHALGSLAADQTLRTAPTDGAFARSAWQHLPRGLYAAAILIELAAEPAYVLFQDQCLFRERTRIEGAAFVVHGVATIGGLLLVQYGLPDLGKPVPSSPSSIPERAVVEHTEKLIVFGIAQCVAALVLLIRFRQGLRRHPVLSTVSPWPRRLDRATPFSQETASAASSRVSSVVAGIARWLAPWIDPAQLMLAAAFTTQSVIKQLLTEGDAYVLSLLGSAADQGVYRLVVNLGSLVVRVLFAPLEETARVLFAKAFTSHGGASTRAESTPLVSGTNASPMTADAMDAMDTVIMANPADRAEAAFQEAAVDWLFCLMQWQLILGLILIGFAPPFAPLAVLLLAGQHWVAATAAPAALALYALSIPLMGLNGPSEGFLQATASRAALAQQTLWFAVCTAVFMAAATAAHVTPLRGVRGLIAANMLHMGLRIAFNLRYIRGFLGPARWRRARLVPRSFPALLAVAGVSRAVLEYGRPPVPAGGGVGVGRALLSMWRPTLLHLGTGGVLGLVFLAVVAILEHRHLVATTLRIWRGRSAAST